MAAEKLVSFTAGAVATVAGIYFAFKVKDAFSKKPKMKVKNNQLLLSTRCTWLISELGAESDFNLNEDMKRKAKQEGTEDGMRLLSLEHNNIPEDELAPLPLVTYAGGEQIHCDYDDDDDMLPAMVVNDEFTMIEGAAICMYLADQYNRFLPDDEHKAEYYNWIVYSAATFDNIMKTLQHQLVDTPVSRQDEAVIESATKGFHSFARALSDTMENREYICGQQFTAADCVLGFTLWWAYTIQKGALLKEYPSLLAYLDRLKERPAFHKTFGDEEEWDWARYFDTYLCGYLKE